MLYQRGYPGRLSREVIHGGYTMEVIRVIPQLVYAS